MKETSLEHRPSPLKVRRNPFAVVPEKIRENSNCQVEETTLERSGVFPKGWLDDEDPKD